MTSAPTVSAVMDGGLDAAVSASALSSNPLPDSGITFDAGSADGGFGTDGGPMGDGSVDPGADAGDAGAPVEEADPAEIRIGERLFLETRFAEYFYSNAGGDMNALLATGDPVMDQTVTLAESFAGPFAGQSMNCGACHLVDQHLEAVGGGMRTYGDFARRSPIPERGDGQSFTPRNSPPLVNASRARDVALVLHFDGEFPSMPALVEGTLTGRNYGWLPHEGATAKEHIANVLRSDDGSSDLASESGSLSYATVLTGTDSSIPPELVLPEEFRVDVETATDAELLEAVKRLIATYVDHLAFSQDEAGNYNLSPYDAFLAKNGLPTQPDLGESSADYAARLLVEVNALNTPLWVGAEDGDFTFHDRAFEFGPDELSGLKIFLSAPSDAFASPSELSAGGLGNCVACHAPPHFTDFGFHNTGATQVEYDAVHTAGAFAALVIPDLATRDADYDAFLPPTGTHPNASGVFRAVPDAGHPQQVDLGAWNIALNPEHPLSDAALHSLLCVNSVDCSTNALYLEQSIATFKTAGLRDLGHSAPYLHTGQLDTLEDVLDFYIDIADKSRLDEVRNPDPELARIALVAGDVAPLAAFLRSLDEDYE
jgi:hypothetical protein